jgi:hypothetical protein
LTRSDLFFALFLSGRSFLLDQASRRCRSFPEQDRIDGPVLGRTQAQCLKAHHANEFAPVRLYFAMASDDERFFDRYGRTYLPTDSSFIVEKIGRNPYVLRDTRYHYRFWENVRRKEYVKLMGPIWCYKS